MTTPISITGKAALPGWRTYNVDLSVQVSLRDLFAAFALTGIIASDGNPNAIGEAWAANAAYTMADAMLAQRAQDKEQCK